MSRNPWVARTATKASTGRRFMGRSESVRVPKVSWAPDPSELALGSTLTGGLLRRAPCDSPKSFRKASGQHFDAISLANLEAYFLLCKHSHACLCRPIESTEHCTAVPDHARRGAILLHCCVAQVSGGVCPESSVLPASSRKLVLPNKVNWSTPTNAFSSGSLAPAPVEAPASGGAGAPPPRAKDATAAECLGQEVFQ